VAGDEGFAEFAHGHEYGGHFLWLLLSDMMLLDFCWIERCRCRCGRGGGRIDVEAVEGGFEALAAGMGGAEFHVAGDYAFKVCFLCLEICQSIASWSV
jgi:hypothetical protein